MITVAPLLEVAPGGRFKLHTAMVYRWLRKDVHVTIPAGTFTDFASIPRLFRWLIPVNGRHRLPAILHDYLYGSGGELPCGVQYTREEADQEFYTAMRHQGVRRLKALVMYRAVRVFGGLFWRENSDK